jgi:transcriptional regulator with XRE-family HTH domain
MQIDRAGLADFLRHRRAALQPEDVGLPRGERRRTTGLRREEAAALAHMSTDYFARLERAEGPRPSDQMIAAIAQGLHLSPAERDHLFRLAGIHPPVREAADDHVSPGMLRVLDRLTDTPAEVVTELGETLRQTPLGVALTGETASLRGPMRSIGYRWFADPASRRIYDPADHAFLSRLWVSGLREVAGRRGPKSRAAQMAELLLQESAEFHELWDAHEVGLRPGASKRFVHPELGALELACQTLNDPVSSQSLLVYTAEPGSESAEKLELLSVIGAQRL